jgi:DNA polymerase-1
MRQGETITITGNTFQPLYGGAGATDASRAYAEAFFKEHTGIARWHDELCKEALTNKQVVTPSGRIFAFPDVRRDERGKVQGKTQLVNYPVQSFATADLAWAVIIPLWREMKVLGLQSKLVLQVHDDVVPDVHPSEVDIMQKLIIKHFSAVHQYLTERFKYATNVPIGFEVSIGGNLMEKKTVYKHD